MEEAKLKEEEKEEEEEKEMEEEKDEKEMEKEMKREGEELRELEQTLDKVQINLSAPHLSEQTPKVDQSECPASYSKNSAKEELLVSMAENFHAQYSYLYPDRKPLLLCPANEFGVQKFVSTTLQCTLLPYYKLYDWQGCACFISDFLTLEQLDCPTEVPKQLYSPTWVVRTRRGTCFDFSTLLCSLLLGAGYDAYCVSGYAVKEMCLLDLSHQECPLLKSQDTAEEKPPERKEQVKKYRVKPTRELKSTFEERQEKKHQQELQVLLAKQQEDERLQEGQGPPPDPLLGQRVHSWVLVLAGKRDILENFFIDPLSGQSYPMSSECFLGVESVWNHENYWVNMQDCRYGCKVMSFDLDDVLKWEYMLCGPRSSSLLGDTLGDEKEELNDEEIEEIKVFEMPLSWVTQIHISEEDMERRFPGGSKVIHYRKATLERFSPYLLKDGLVTRLSIYDDLECTQLNTVKEWYENRQDELQERELKKATSVTTERFSSGSSFCLKTHRYVTLVPGTERLMEFYSKARDDNLVSRAETQTEMTETFQDRSDFLYYRHVIYGPLEPEQMLGVQRPIQTVVVKFHRDRSKPASEDVAELIFQISQNRIEATYHLENNRIIPNFHIFKKPPNLDCPFSDKMVSSFQVDPLAKPVSKLYLYQTLMALMQEEEKVLISIKDSEDEVKEILSVREQEESAIMLKISIYDTARNEKARLHVENLKFLAKEQLKKEHEDVDILAPFLAQLGDPACLAKQQAMHIHAECLNNLKQRLIDRANLIQARYEKETQELQQKQQWYQKNQFNLTKQDEEEYLAFCADAMFKIKILKLRLSRHKDRAPQKYIALDKMLRQDPRLMQHLD